MDILLHPAYFPNVVTFACLMRAHTVWEVWDNYQKQTFRNRCHICTDRGRHMLNIPIRHLGSTGGRQRTRDVEIDNSYPWQRQHWRSLQTAYRSAPFFEFYEEELRPVFERPFRFLMELNLESTRLLCQFLELPFPEAQTSAYQQQPAGINDVRYLVDAKSDLSLELPAYPQVFAERHGFVANASTLDLLFNEGPAARTYLEQLEIPLND